ncbi:hypothetical protein [Nocardioides marmoribigeumensis]|uniref:DUF4386 family protein n=1 Tax=Nocardioides marmoribigeumensis TaxID=433649 RepID=A0ABU2BUV2_9ACTN|nr:hypothetical protein [Nocardioides marmoribigeumensis]MDR7361528.1 hypothetical protein [Nocardioides marmoribigeumensis]
MTSVTQATTTTPDPTVPTGAEEAQRLGRLGGALGLTHVVLVFAAITQEVLVEHGASAAQLRHVYGSADLTRVFGAGYVEAASFLLLVPALVLVAGAVGRGSAYARAAAQSFLALGIVLAASTLAVGFPPGAAALYGAQHGADASAVAMVNDIRNFGYVLQVSAQGAMAVALGLAVLAGGAQRRTLGWVSIAIGAFVVLGTPFFHNVMGMVGILWWVAVCITLLRGTPARD